MLSFNEIMENNEELKFKKDSIIIWDSETGEDFEEFLYSHFFEEDIEAIRKAKYEYKSKSGEYKAIGFDFGFIFSYEFEEMKKRKEEITGEIKKVSKELDRYRNSNKLFSQMAKENKEKVLILIDVDGTLEAKSIKVDRDFIKENSEYFMKKETEKLKELKELIREYEEICR